MCKILMYHEFINRAFTVNEFEKCQKSYNLNLKNINFLKNLSLNKKKPKLKKITTKKAFSPTLGMNISKSCLLKV